jgi:WD40 repeat protein
VGHLSVTPDGKFALSDHGDQLWIRDLDNRTQVGAISSFGQGHFINLAMFTPSGRWILGQTANGRLQLWSLPSNLEETEFFRNGYAAGFRRNSPFVLSALGATLVPAGYMAFPGIAAIAAEQPTELPPLEANAFAPSLTPAAHMAFPTVLLNVRETRGLTAIPELWRIAPYEIGHLETPANANVTCGVFLPNTGNSPPVLFTGGKDNAVRVWDLPSATDCLEPLEAVITSVGLQVESGTGLIRFRAELDNPPDRDWRLYPGTRVDLTIYPEAKPNKQQRSAAAR